MHAVVYAAHNHIIQLLIIIIIVVAQSQPIECVANDADNTHTHADCTGTCSYHASLCDMHTQYTHTRTNKRPQFRHEILINILHDFRYKCVKMNTHFAIGCNFVCTKGVWCNTLLSLPPSIVNRSENFQYENRSRLNECLFLGKSLVAPPIIGADHQRVSNKLLKMFVWIN